MNTYGVKIESDFTDYYDYLSSNKTNSRVYRRLSTDLIGKDKAIGLLKRSKLKTAYTGAVKDIAHISKQLIVYKDAKRRVRSLMESDEAVLVYPNYYASVFYDESDGIVCKILQIGDRRFRVITKRDIISGMKSVVSVEEIFGIHRKSISYPIFSIDFIPTKDGLLAVGINNVEMLWGLGMDNVISAEEIIRQIYLVLKG